jgi:hypothetical protein
MKTITLLVGLVCTTLPAAAQSKVYTNADLGTVHRTRTVTAAELEGLAARQFVFVPSRPPAPVVVIGRDVAAGPFGAFAPPLPERRLDGSLWTDPPWEQFAYVGYPSHVHGALNPRTGPRRSNSRPVTSGSAPSPSSRRD